MEYNYCNDFINRKCKRDNCKYVHEKDICSHYWNYGKCKFNDDCRFKHKDNPKQIERSFNSNDGKDNEGQQINENKKRSKVKNTECFIPINKNTVDMRVVFHDVKMHNGVFDEKLTSRDVLMVSNLFSDYKNGEIYAKLVGEIENCGIPLEQLLKLWHGNDKIEGTHLIADDHLDWKSKCPTFNMVIDRIRNYFEMDIKSTRFNWYKDTSQWKAFHFDASAVKPHIAKIQNFTLAVSFGVTRDAAFEHAKTKTIVSLPQPDSTIYAFAKDTNIMWRHGILQDIPIRNEGRISIIAWGWCNHF